MNKKILLIFFTIVSISTFTFAQEKTKDGVTFTIEQINPKAVSAFFLARGFNMQEIQPYSDTCVYTTTLKNNNDKKSIHYLRKNWFAKKGTTVYAVKNNEYWLKVTKANPSSWIAFRLAQMPEEQVYEPKGDWNQGMLSINLPLENTFDMTIIWDIKEKIHQLTIKGINCAK